MDLTQFAEQVGADGPVTVCGKATRGGAVSGVRVVQSPAGVAEFLPAEMTVRCGAGTAIDELQSALGGAGQRVSLPPGGTVGGALAVGRSGVMRLGHGPLRDTVLQARYISAEGVVVKAGGPTVKNVSGFDVCRLLVGSRGTLGFLGEVILRTRPRPAVTRWIRTDGADPFGLLSTLYRPAAVLWDGATTWICLEGHPGDVTEQMSLVRGAQEIDGPPALPVGSRRSLPPTGLATLSGRFVAEIGVGVVHHDEPWTGPPAAAAEIVALHARLKHLFDPMGRMNPGVDVLAVAS